LSKGCKHGSSIYQAFTQNYGFNLKFSKRYLEKCYRSKKDAIRRWGTDVGERYINRISTLYAVESINDLYKIPQLSFHPLTGDRKGQYAISLTGRARLIVEIEENQIIIEKVSTDHYE
jgi:toxin HigB-1